MKISNIRTKKKTQKKSDLSKQGTPLNAAFHRLRVSESFIVVDGDTPTWRSDFWILDFFGRKRKVNQETCSIQL